MRGSFATIIVCAHAHFAVAAGQIFGDFEKQLLIDGGNFVTGRSSDQVLAVATDGMFYGGVPPPDGPWWMFVGGTKIDVVDGTSAAKVASSKSHLVVKAFNDINYDVREHGQKWPHVVRHEWLHVVWTIAPRSYAFACVVEQRLRVFEPNAHGWPDKIPAECKKGAV